MKEDQREILKAWIDGAVIQYKDGDNWSDCCAFDSCNRVYFNDDQIYRIKPERFVTETCITHYNNSDGKLLHSTYTNNTDAVNLRLTWEEGKLIKAEVI